MRQAPWTPEGGASRRRLLKRSGAALAAAAGASGAGCLSFLPPASREGRYGPVDVPTDRTTDRPTYRKWFPAEAALPDLGYAEGYDDGNFVYVTPGDLGTDAFGAPFDIGRSILQASMDYVGYGITEFDALVGVGPVGTVATGDVDRGRVQDVVDATPYEPAGFHRSFDVYERSDRERLLAVGDHALVQTRGTNHRAKAEAIVDAAGGHVGRRHESDEPFERLTGFVGSAPTIMDGFGVLDDTLADVMWYTFDDDSAYFVHEQLFADGATPSEGEVKRVAGEFSRTDSASRIEVTIDEPRVTIAWQLDGGAFTDRGEYRPLPLVTWAVDETDETVTVRHAAGDPVPVDRLQIIPEDALRDPPASDAVLEPGDELVFERAAIEVSTIQFSFNHSGESRTLMFSYDPSENDTTT